MAKGKLITFEGGEGGGKTTQIVLLRDKLLEKGYNVIVLREPGGTNISEQIREVVLSTKNTGIVPIAEVLLFQAARAQIYGEVVAPALENGKIVLMDRSRDSSVVYQGLVRGFGKAMIEELNDISTQKIYPNLTLLLDVDIKTGLQRQAEAGGNNRFEMENADFHQKVREAYLSLAEENQHDRWVVIDANKDLTTVQQEIWQKISAYLK